MAPQPPRMVREASKAEHLLTELQGLASLLEVPSCLDTHLHQLASAAVRLLNAERCTFVWLHEEYATADSDAALASVSTQIATHDKAVFKRVIVENPAKPTEETPAASEPSVPDHPGVASGNALSAPVKGGGRVIGVVHVSGPKDKRDFNHEDVWLLNVVTVYIGKSLHMVQLRNLLHSRFAQIALAQRADDVSGKMLTAVPHPGRLVETLARSFYREMRKAGFGANEIINAASQVISELTASLKRSPKRRNGGPGGKVGPRGAERAPDARVLAPGRHPLSAAAVE